MKSRKHGRPSSKGKVQIKSLKLTRESVEDLSGRDIAATIKGGRSSGGGSIPSGPASGGT